MFGKLFVSLSRSVYMSVYNIYNAWAHQTTHNKSFVTFGWCEREEEWENPDKNQRGRAVLSVSLKRSYFFFVSFLLQYLVDPIKP